MGPRKPAPDEPPPAPPPAADPPGQGINRRRPLLLAATLLAFALWILYLVRAAL